MALLHAVARVAPRSVRAVATFDHGTGPAATRAAQLVARHAASLGFPVVIGRAPAGTPKTEAAWRAARQHFLGEVAARTRAQVATAHTRDDQVETVLMRVMRDAGPRGLAALYAPGDMVRPLLHVSRDEVARYAAATGLEWVEDPTNLSSRHLRNRVRRDLLPALERERPGFARALLAIARRAARWRRDVDRAARGVATLDDRGRAIVAADQVQRDVAQLSVLWPSIAARLGVAMDRRGTVRAAEFTRTATPGARMQLAGGFEIERTREAFELHRASSGTPAGAAALSLGEWNGWRFAPLADPAGAPDPWTAWLPARAQVTVRAWQPGDRMRVQSGVRKVKRFLSDAHISGPRRMQWPVVLVNDEIVWIPGVRQTDRVSPRARTGEQGLVYRCVPDER